MPYLPTDVHLAHARHELAAMRALLTPLDLPVPACPGWTLRDLAEHVGGYNLWVAAAINEGHGDLEPPPAPEDVLAWFDANAAQELAALALDPSTPAWTFGDDRTVAFWRRRRCFEFLIHRWDAEDAHGAPGPIDAELAWDGVLEAVEFFAPRQVRLGRIEAPAYAVEVSDGARSVAFGPGEPAVRVEGTAEELLLGLWGRRPLPGGVDLSHWTP
ncbi:hypothetical protein Afil01_17630 [Actinorhabdospora filicis]|uniref:Maleylpyruvate isomerase family mycothiol-dependent enzyme n=1 Tax=Actinorhabdospora filicis TaxID=1785913 RepID=A0A9W6W8Y6_9ACTN|nr:maleylpyruvate isomerase family mycothiol-dependent enzyme [Actinorhabdospora filicis]GLZ76956.1 hypothetical protein Afil01_17630 [Actinorhabdospora filicis]